MKFILASQSPRRRELLAMIVPEFLVRVSPDEEVLPPGVPPEEAVQTLALAKAQGVARTLPQNLREDPQGWCVMGADTVVTIDGAILGKPHSRAECCQMLGRLSGRTHTVCTGVAVLTQEAQRVFCQTTQVAFYPLTQEEICRYADTPEPYDKAGAYGIQGQGSVLVREIQGDFYTVMGLPVARLYRVLKEMGVF